MDDNKKKMYEEALGKELFNGLIELQKTEPVIQAIFKHNDTNELAKRIASALLIIVDNRNKVLRSVVKMANVKI